MFVKKVGEKEKTNKMSTNDSSTYWNYRIVRSKLEDGSFSFGIHEVYYTNDIPDSLTVSSLSITEDTEEEVKNNVLKYYQAVDKAVLNAEDILSRNSEMIQKDVSSAISFNPESFNIEEIATWRILINAEASRYNDILDSCFKCTLSESELDQKFNTGYGTIEGLTFTAWSNNRVYFPVQYDGSEWCGSVVRNPDNNPTNHLGR